jgi:L-alanine-DL-glutamate epimerase-like enolase superfamily enzyme
LKIAKIDLIPFDLPLRQSLQTGWGEIQARSGFVIKISDYDGNIGIGEATPLTGFGMEDLNQTAIALQQMQPSLLGQEIFKTRAIANLLTNFQRFPAARHGMELALLDLLAINQNKPLAKLLVSEILADEILANEPLGAEILPRTEIKVNALIGITSPELAAAQAQDLRNQGYDCIKIKVGNQVGQFGEAAIANSPISHPDQYVINPNSDRASNFAADYQRIAAVRQVCGSDLQIRLDANQSWTVAEAIANLSQLALLGIEYVEQPIDRDDLRGMAKIRNAATIPIAADEAVQNLTDLDRLIAAQAADVVILKPMAMGGVLIAQQAAEIAAQAGLAVVITTTIDGAIAQLGALHLAAAIPNLTRACGLATHGLLAQNLVGEKTIDQLMPRGGTVRLSERSGLGISASELIV